MRTKMMAVAVAASAALLVAACGGDDDDDTSSGTTQADPATTEAAAGSPSASVVGTGDTDLGEVLTDAAGLTLYGFTEDSPGSSSCEADCAAAWPPLTVESAELPAGLDAGRYSVVERPDGTFQLAANDMPLYTFGGDEAPGDVNGQGVGGSWFAVDGAGQLLRDAGAGSGGSGSGDTEPATTAGGGPGY